MGMQFARIVQSYIWVKDVWGMGRNADHGAGPTKTRVLTGAALKNTGLTAVLGLCATDHTIQVDPGEVHLVRAHFCKGPGAVARAGSRAAPLAHAVNDSVTAAGPAP